jgi:hypothetical protein
MFISDTVEVRMSSDERNLCESVPEGLEEQHDVNARELGRCHEVYMRPNLESEVMTSMTCIPVTN